MPRNLRAELLTTLNTIDEWTEEVRERVTTWRKRLKYAAEHETPWTEINTVIEEMEAFLQK